MLNKLLFIILLKKTILKNADRDKLLILVYEIFITN